MPTTLQKHTRNAVAKQRLFYQVLTLMLMVALWAQTMPLRAHAATGQAFIRLVQGFPQAPLLDVYVNGVRITEAARYADISEYEPVTAGQQRVEVMQTGAKPGSEGLIISGTFQLSAGQDYSLLALGVSKMSLQLLEDDNTIDDEGRAKIRLVHASADSPSIDIVTADADHTMLFKNVTYKTITPYSTVAPGAYSLLVRPTGTDANVLDVKGLFLELGSVSTIYTFGSWSGMPRFALRVSKDLRPDIILPVTGADWSSS